MKRRSIIHWALAGLLTIVATVAARATVLVPADLGELVRGSQAVVHGRVVETRAVWADGRRRVDTLVTIEALGYFKGSFGPEVTFRVPGGQMGRYRSVMVGAPVFTEGDEVVLFLNARGPSVPYVLGLSQGVFRVIDDPQTSGKVVLPPPVIAGVSIEPVKRGDSARRPMSLERFGDEVRKLTGGGAR